MDTTELRPCDRVSSGHYDGDGYLRGNRFEETKARKGSAAELDRIRRECERIGKAAEEVEEAAYFHYCEIGECAVNAELRAAAEKAAELFRSWSGSTGSVKLIWVEEEGETERRYFETYHVRDWESHAKSERVNGFASPLANEVYINAALTVDHVPEIVAHELAHCPQNPYKMGLEEREEQAERVASAFVAKFYPRRDPREILQALAYQTGRVVFVEGAGQWL